MDTYWAAKPTDEIVNAIKPKIDLYYDWLRSSGRLAMWSRMHRQYYAGLIEGGSLQNDGDVDELIAMNVNDFRNLVQHLIVMTTSQRPQFEPRAVNADHKSQTQTILAAGILEYVLKEKNLEATSIEALEASLLFGDAFLAVDWDASLGPDYAVSPQPGPDGQEQTQKAGDLVFRMYSPIDAVRDFTKTRQEEHQWYAGRRWVNRWDLAAKYPEYADRIINMPSRVDPINRPRFVNMFVNLYRYDSEDVEVWEFYHEESPALPNGRRVEFLLDAGDMPPLFDGPIPYDDLSFYRLSPAPMQGTSHGYSPAYDLLSLQEAENALWTTLASNIAAFGVQNILVPEGSNLDVQNLGGLKVIKFDSKLGPPQGLNLTQNSPDTYKLLELIIAAGERVSAINSVQRGTPDHSFKPEAMAAMLAQAQSFSVGLQQSWARFMESVATGVIHIYKTFAQAPQVAMIAGKSNRSFIVEFTGDQLDRIDRVAVDLSNPLSRTVPGRIQMADMLGQKGLLKTPEEYIQVLTTGRLEPVLEATQKEMLSIKAENEKLAESGSEPPTMPGMPPAPPPVVAVLTDNHPAHIREHAAVAASPEARENPALMQNVLGHIQEHVNLWVTMPPPLAMALGIPPPPMMGPPPSVAPPGAPGATSATPPPEPGQPTLAGNGQQPEQQAHGPNGMPLPKMPKNPLTGERGHAAPPPSA